jgi:hypothetical protein
VSSQNADPTPAIKKRDVIDRRDGRHGHSDEAVMTVQLIILAMMVAIAVASLVVM